MSPKIKKKGNQINIKEQPDLKNIKKKTIEEYDYPIFCFKYLNDTSYKDCVDVTFFIRYLNRLQKLSELGWAEIRKSTPHSFGMEKIPIHKIKPVLPSILTPEVTSLHVLRATGGNHPFVGLQNSKVFQVFFIEANFGDIYNH